MLLTNSGISTIIVIIYIMVQTINMLYLRQRVGQVIDETLYLKNRFLIKRKEKPVAVIIPIEDYETFIDSDENIEIYSKDRIKEFEKTDRLTKKQKAALQNLLSS